MERWAKPVAVITTIQPYLMMWVLGITFFVALTLVAVVSRGRSWKQLVGIFLICFVLLSIVSLVSTRFTTIVQVFDIEIVSAN